MDTRDTRVEVQPTLIDITVHDKDGSADYLEISGGPGEFQLIVGSKTGITNIHLTAEQLRGMVRVLSAMV